MINPAFGKNNNLLIDPSFEITKEPDKFGRVFSKWDGWKYEGDCKFKIGKISKTGKNSCQLAGYGPCKIRISQSVMLAPGRYQITAWIRGLDIGTGKWNRTTEFMFNKKYFQLNKKGSFDWIKLSYIGEVSKKGKVPVSFGLLAPGFFWIDDVSLTRVSKQTPLTDKPFIENKRKPITPPSELGGITDFVRCSECDYRNNIKWKTCFACGEPLIEKSKRTGLAIKLLNSFEQKNDFKKSTIVTNHATHGKKAALLKRGFTYWDGKLDFTGYDYFKADLYSEKTQKLYVEIQDKHTSGYYTRVNHHSLIPAGHSTLILSLDQLFVGEKGRPGRKLDLANITRFVFSIGETPKSPLYFDNLRLEQDVEVEKNQFKGLYAFDLGKQDSPLMPGFTKITQASNYTKGRGYGLKNVNVWRSFNVLQPEPLYQDFICIQKGGMAVDLPNGRYHVFVNMDNPSGFWGSYQAYKTRSITAEGKKVVTDKLNYESFIKKYYRFWNLEDSPEISTFDKYQKAYYQEKQFDIDVNDGQLNLDFNGQNWACSVSAIIIYPVEKKSQGKTFLSFVEKQRRFFFDNYFKRAEHLATGDPVVPSTQDKTNGYISFSRDYMDDVYYNDTPRKEEINKTVTGFSFAGDIEPISTSIYPLQNLGKVQYKISDLTGPGIIPATSIKKAYISNRISRVTNDGSVYMIKPRLLMELPDIQIDKGITRRFWFTIKVPDDASPGLYYGSISIIPEHGQKASIPVQFKVYKGQLDPVDIPVGPWGHSINIPWIKNDPKTIQRNKNMAVKSLNRIREYGFTSFSGMPIIQYKGFKTGKPVLDFSFADSQMNMARQAGFTMPIVSYTRLRGIDLYYKDKNAMKKAGFTDYSKFIKTVFSEIQNHANTENWLPVYYNIGDEPWGNKLKLSIENASKYKKAFPEGPPYFTAATSFNTWKKDDLHFELAKNLHIANLNGHNAKTIKLLHDAGGNWAFYNGGNRWTYGIYMYKAVRQFDMKFRLSWHWNATAGDPYYALDSREDDFAWCNSTPNGDLVSSIEFEREMREGLDDYRHMITLARLAEENSGTLGSKQAKALINRRLNAFKLGQKDHSKLYGLTDWNDFRRKIAKTIEKLR